MLFDICGLHACCFFVFFIYRSLVCLADMSVAAKREQQGRWQWRTLSMSSSPSRILHRLMLMPIPSNATAIQTLNPIPSTRANSARGGTAQHARLRGRHPLLLPATTARPDASTLHHC